MVDRGEPVDKRAFNEALVNKEAIGNLKLVVMDDIKTRQERGGDVSEAHSFAHLNNVSRLAPFVGTLYGYTSREQMLAQAASLFHDLVRSPSEDPKVKDEEASSNAAKSKLEELNNVGIVVTTPEAREAIGYAIERQGQYPSWFADPSTREQVPQKLGDKLWLALFVADKLEANGVRVIARRSSFVAGDRLKREDGDWRQFGFKPGQDEGKVVAIESMVRLAIINPEEVYPKRLKPIVGLLYQVQREFVLGICKSLGLSIEDLAKILINTRNKDGKNIVEVRKLKCPSDAEELRRFIESRSGISEKSIQETSADYVSSAMETVNYFSNRYTEDLDNLMTRWGPKGDAARDWQRGMVEYVNGQWFDKVEASLKK
ncbi:MAG: hypothetical protein HY424_02870 [Candidatus Levybacteria bacterium]|nr:hypothetical protein [Candidatus Levybacteria bacterium]